MHIHTFTACYVVYMYKYFIQKTHLDLHGRFTINCTVHVLYMPCSIQSGAFRFSLVVPEVIQLQ